MPKENKSTSRRSRRQCSEVDNEAATSSVRDSAKSAIGNNRYSPFPREVPRKDSKTKQENMNMPTVEILHTTSSGIIESGIKYILFPLHLLRFCIFGTSTRTIASEKTEGSTRTEDKSKHNDAEKDEKKTKERKEKSDKPKEAVNGKSDPDKFGKNKTDRDSSKKSEDVVSSAKNSEKTRNDSVKNESADEMVTAEEDSDSAGEQWSTANDMTAMNISFERSLSYTMLEEPMDISMEELNFDKTHTVLNLSRDCLASKQLQSNKENVVSKVNVDEQDSNSSVDEEIARIFQKQCTSSDDEVSPSFSKLSSFRRERTKQNNFLYYRQNNYSSSAVAVHTKKESKSNTKEERKKQSSDVSVNSKRRKVSHEEDKNEKQSDRRTGSKVRDEREKRSSRHDTTPSKHESRAARTPVKNKESKRKDVKYKETATQTDSAFSDEDVEMIPVDTKLYDKHCYRRTGRRLQFNLFEDKDMEQELCYIADNEDSNDGTSKIVRKRISSGSTSSSSTDLGFDERTSTTPDMDLAVRRSRNNSVDNINNFRTRSRPPPGFPELPQNPPLTSHICNCSKQFFVTHSKHNYPNPWIVPRAPSPMRHLYYDYPEFMDLPMNVSSSKILNDILRNNYYR